MVNCVKASDCTSGHTRSRAFKFFPGADLSRTFEREATFIIIAVTARGVRTIASPNPTNKDQIDAEFAAQSLARDGR